MCTGTVGPLSEPPELLDGTVATLPTEVHRPGRGCAETGPQRGHPRGSGQEHHLPQGQRAGLVHP
jgi:hypothetical protein